MSRKRYFDSVPSVARKRWNFDKSHRVLTSMPIGKLVPVDIVEVLPGDTWTVKQHSLSRLASPLVRPIMDNVFLDSYSFFVPLRLCQDNLEDVFGDSSPSAYESPDLAEIAHIEFSPDDPGNLSFDLGSVWDYLGLPSGTSLAENPIRSGSYSALPPRAFALIWNEFFRNEAIDDEVLVQKGAYNSLLEMPNNQPWSATNYTGMLPPVSRYRDYFSTCLPAPQKGPSVLIPGIQGAPVGTGSIQTNVDDFPNDLLWSVVDNSSGTRTLRSPAAGPVGISRTTSDLAKSLQSTLSGGSFTSGANIVPRNLALDPNGESGYTIDALRTAFQLQKYLTRDSIYGSRYREYLYAAYGVASPDSRVQVPEFLSGSHERLSVSQVAATSTNSESDYPVGQFAGVIHSHSQKNNRFSKSFVEHGYVITVACIRYKHLYSQSVQPLWSRTSRMHFYDPLFQNLGQQAVPVNQVYASANFLNSQVPVLGYQEAWSDYRTILDRVSGQMRPYDGSLGIHWSLADVFDSQPSLLDLIHETDAPWRRVLPTYLTDPFIVDFYFETSVASTVSGFSMPGLVDHH